MQMEADQFTSDHIGVFSGKYRPKNKPICYCFYATIKGQVPEEKEVNGAIILVMQKMY
jgi:hypothetical protein